MHDPRLLIDGVPAGGQTMKIFGQTDDRDLLVLFVSHRYQKMRFAQRHEKVRLARQEERFY